MKFALSLIIVKFMCCAGNEISIHVVTRNKYDIVQLSVGNVSRFSYVHDTSTWGHRISVLNFRNVEIYLPFILLVKLSTFPEKMSWR